MKLARFSANIFKIVLSGLIISGLVVMGVLLFRDKSWFLSIFLFASAGLIVYFYFIRKGVPGKYLLPGILLLFLFQIYPSFYSGYVSFTNDSNGHQLSKSQAIEAIIQDSNIPVQDSAGVPYVATRDLSSKKIFLAFQYPKGSFWVGNTGEARLLPANDVTVNGDGKIIAVAGFEVLSPAATRDVSSELGSLQVRLKDETLFQAADFEYLQISKPTFSYSAATDRLTNLKTGEQYRPNNNGQMVNASGETLTPGWKAFVGWKNFSDILRNPEISRPLLKVLIWTFVNAGLVVTISFLLGLFLALVMNSPLLFSKRFYRTLFLVPLAMPSVLSVLVWSGLFTTKTGVIDRLFHISTPWLTSAWPARLAVVIVEVWLAFPYMFLITTGAIQAIPGEIIEAAQIDGASPLQIFRRLKLPLVFRTLSPLLIAACAMALNNFGIIFLLTNGGPIFSNSNGNAGATDILISYTYKLAFNSQEGSNYGLASALSILNFVLVAVMSIYGLRRIKTMEGIN